MLIRIIKNYNDVTYDRFSPEYSMRWGDIVFTEDCVRECDGVVVLNSPRKNITLKVYVNNIMAVMQEPYHSGDTDWMNEQLEVYNFIITSHQPRFLSESQIILTHGSLPWHVLKSYDELKAIRGG